jgi:hypothetical protein
MAQKVSELTKALNGLIPEEIRQLITAVYEDNTIDPKEEGVQDYLPPQYVIDIVLAVAGLGEDQPASKLDQASAWIREQVEWQTRAMKVMGALNEHDPMSVEEAVKGNFPEWFREKFAPKLNYLWSEGLEKSVLEAETWLNNAKAGAV